MRLRIPAVSLAALWLALPLCSADADVLVDQLCIVDFLEYDQGSVASIVGGAAAGMEVDSQIVDDFVVPVGDGLGFVVTDVTFDYLAFLGAGSPPSTVVEVFPDAGGVPSEVPVYTGIHATTSTSWTPLQPLFKGERHRASGLAIELAPGRYWIGMQPITITGAVWLGTGDILFPVQNTAFRTCVGAPGFPTHFREPGLDPDFPHDGSLGFGPLPGGLCTSPSGPCPDFTRLADSRIDLGDGPTSFKVEGVPVEAPPDFDEDGVPDESDNCVEVPNPDQRDTNADGFGNICDPDYNDDLAVGIPDFSVLRSFFGGPPGPSGLDCAGTIPCPDE